MSVSDPILRAPSLSRADPNVRVGKVAEASATIVLLGLLVAAPALFSRATVNDLGQAVCLGLFAISFNLLFKYSGLLSFGHAAFFGFAAYAEAVLLQRLPAIPVPLLVLAAGFSAGLLGLVLGQICVRRSGAYSR